MKHLALILLGLFLGTPQTFAQTAIPSESLDKSRLKQAIESGEADATDFMSFVGAEPRRLLALSPTAIANYLEALANEGLLGLLSPVLLEAEVIWTALDVVFEDPSNADRNRSIFESYGQLKEIESGSAGAAVFVSAIRENPSRLKKLSVSAVANYMEALANEGMLELIPPEYYGDKVILTALEVVFEDPGNAARNWPILDEFVRWMTSSTCRC